MQAHPYNPACPTKPFVAHLRENEMTLRPLTCEPKGVYNHPTFHAAIRADGMS
jgi:hypothetical protein